MFQNQQDVIRTVEKLITCCENLLGKSCDEISVKFKGNGFVSPLEEIQEYYEKEDISEKFVAAMPEILSVKAAAVRVADFAAAGDKRAVKKLEFELLPLLENMRMDFYYYCIIADDKEKKKHFWEKEYAIYYRNRYLEEAKKTGKHKYDLSIQILSYNKLEYTKLCIESLKNNLPKNITYELIFINHGSTDGTKEYLESQNPDKQLDIEVNGGGAMAAFLLAEGEYILQISNDVLVTKNAIENMYACITSSADIGWVVPTTTNVSNYQTIKGNYTTADEVLQFAEKNNISNPDRWEEKPRLCNPIDMVKKQVWFENVGRVMPKIWGISFTDDKIGTCIRRGGYKLILAKDAFCYHFGSVTINPQMENERKKRINYCKGRIEFIREFGMDPWGYGMAYDSGLVQKIEKCDLPAERILGINSGLGGTPLKIKDMKGRSGKLVYITQYAMNWEDIKTLGDEAYRLEDWTECDEVLKEKYDYILLENGVESSNVTKILGLKNFLSKKGILLVRTEDEMLAKIIMSVCNGKEIIEGISGWWVLI